MTLHIPSWLLDLHEQYVDEMIDSDLSVPCEVFYEPKMMPCANCLPNPIGNKSSNTHRSGGPVPFPQNSTCPVCNGDGFRQEPNSETFNMQIYTNPIDFTKLGIPIKNPDGIIIVKGYMTDWPKLQRSIHVKVNQPIYPFISTTYTLSGEAIAHGFRNNRYFLAKLKHA